MHALAAALVIAPGLRFHIGNVDDVAEHLALPGLRRRRAEMRAETIQDAGHVVGIEAFGAEATEQDEAAAVAEVVAQRGKACAQMGEGEVFGRDVRKIWPPARLQLAQTGGNFIQVRGRKLMEAFSAIVDLGAGHAALLAIGLRSVIGASLREVRLFGYQRPGGQCASLLQAVAEIVMTC